MDAASSEARWPANFRDLNAAVVRMATLTPSGRITVASVDEEIARLRAAWAPRGEQATGGLVEEILGPARAKDVDLFDRVQLETVLQACRVARSLSQAGRELFHSSRARRSSVNEADRLRKYLARHGMSWADVQGEG